MYQIPMTGIRNLNTRSQWVEHVRLYSSQVLKLLASCAHKLPSCSETDWSAGMGVGGSI